MNLYKYPSMSQIWGIQASSFQLLHPLPVTNLFSILQIYKKSACRSTPVQRPRSIPLLTSTQGHSTYDSQGRSTHNIPLSAGMSGRHLAQPGQELEEAFAGLATSLKTADYLKQVGQKIEKAFAGLATSLQDVDQKLLAEDAISTIHTKYRAWQTKAKLYAKGDESLDFGSAGTMHSISLPAI